MESILTIRPLLATFSAHSIQPEGEEPLEDIQKMNDKDPSVSWDQLLVQHFMKVWASSSGQVKSKIAVRIFHMEHFEEMSREENLALSYPSDFID